jgi:hypothetical protein
MKQSKGYVHKEHKIMDNWKPTEVYDNVVPNQYRTKEFSRQPKFVRSQPNHLGDTLMRDGGF